MVLPLDARLKKQTDSAIADLYSNTPPNNAAIGALGGVAAASLLPADNPVGAASGY